MVPCSTPRDWRVCDDCGHARAYQALYGDDECLDCGTVLVHDDEVQGNRCRCCDGGVEERARMVIRRTEWRNQSGNRTAPSGTMEPAPSSRVVGWRPTCACPSHVPVPATVLDPFSGTGTTLMVADRLGRDAIGIELQPDYVALSTTRVTQDAPLFAEVRHVARQEVLL